MPISNSRRPKGGLSENVPINLKGNINPPTITMGVNEEIVGHNIGYDTRLIEEELEERDGVIVPLGAEHGGNNGIAGEDGGANAREDGVAGDGGGVVEVAGSNEGLDAVVEVEAGPGEGGGGVGETRVGGRARGGGVSAEGVEGWLDAEAAFAAAALGGGFLGGGEGEGADGEKRKWGVRGERVVGGGGER